LPEIAPLWIFICFQPVTSNLKQHNKNDISSYYELDTKTRTCRTNLVHQTETIRSPSAPRRTAIIDALQHSGKSTMTMDAEHINSISYKLDDIAQRAAELRRYL
jgi:hypothetical protein